MKLLSLLLLTMIVGKSCSQEAKNNMDNAEIHYEANTRGFFEKIIIKDKMVSVTNDRNNPENKTDSRVSDNDLKQLVGYFKTISLENLPTFKAPSEKRFYDGAAIANLTVIYKGKEYRSVDFDHGNPPKEIEKLVEKITSFSSRK
ncbi:MAG TPA: hypothetical protein VF677_01095 [Flavobacterium sp.]